MSVVEDRLRTLGLTLPPAKAPVANYLGTKRSGDLLFVSGRVSQRRGEVGTDLTLDDARIAARDAMLDLLAIVKQDIGDLDSIASIEQVRGFVRSAPSFVEQPRVIDGASELLVALYGDDGRHARTATGASQLPFGAAVQLEMIVRLRPPHAGSDPRSDPDDHRTRSILT
jgi:enamine deaminase RidA (YjgF/YER057c/UK114 family)